MTDPLEGQDTDESVWEPKQPVVPSTWLLADFGDAFESVSVNQRKVPAKTYKTSGAIPVVDQGQAFIGGYTDDESLAFDPGEGLIVFGDHTRVFKRVSFRFAAGADGIKVLRPLLCDSAYAYYACKSLQFPNRGYSRHYSFLTRCKIPIAPESEQKRIVSKIDELFSRIDEGERALEQVQKLVERYRQSVLKAAVTGELTRAWREKNKDTLESGEALLARILKARREAWEKAELEKMKAKGITPANDKWKQRYEEPSPPDTNGLPELPTGWAWVTLPMLCSENSTNGISVQGSNTPPGVPALRLDAMLTSGFNYSARRYIPITEDQARRLAIIEGDFFVSRANGSLHLVGRAVLANTPPERIVFPDTMIRYRPLTQPDVRAWLAAVWPSRLVRGQLERRAKTTAGIYKVSQDDLSEVALPLPPLSEQAAAVSGAAERMSRIAQLEAEQRHVAKQSSALRQATLKQALTGGLVRQAATDEPASTLLERIAAERGTDNAAPKRGRKKKSAA